MDTNEILNSPTIGNLQRQIDRLFNKNSKLLEKLEQLEKRVLEGKKTPNTSSSNDDNTPNIFSKRLEEFYKNQPPAEVFPDGACYQCLKRDNGTYSCTGACEIHYG